MFPTLTTVFPALTAGRRYRSERQFLMHETAPQIKLMGAKNHAPLSMSVWPKRRSLDLSECSMGSKEALFDELDENVDGGHVSFLDPVGKGES